MSGRPTGLAVQLAAIRPGGYRVVPAGRPVEFTIDMHHDFLTPRGRPYKWSRVTAAFSRTVTGASGATMGWARYQWDAVRASAGNPGGGHPPRLWRFARDQAFHSYLLNTRVTEGPEPAPPVAPANPMLNIAYPALPRSPAVDMLLMLSWDVVTMEMLASQVWTTAGLRTAGRTSELPRISGAQADLRFAAAGSAGLFRNARMTAAWHGVGLRGYRAVCVYRYQCLDCEIAVHSGPIEQRGRSSYWGTVEVDLDTGDLVAAEMTEMIVAMLSGPAGDRVPVQKRRLVQLLAVDGAAAADPSPVPGDTAVPLVEVPAELVAGAADRAAAVAGRLRWQQGMLAGLPASVTSMFSMGFQSVVGMELAGALKRCQQLHTELSEWADGDTAAGIRLREAVLEHRQLLEGLLAFGELATQMAAGMTDAAQAAGLRALCGLPPAEQRRVEDLLAALARLAG